MFKQLGIGTIVAISIGAAAGAVCRYYVGVWIGHFVNSHLPYGTLVVNITGCFVMGLLAALSSKQALSFHPDLQLFILTGFLGSYTTFSSYELDSAKLLFQKDIQADLIYWIGSVLLGFISLQLGITLAESVVKKPSN